MHEVKKRHKQDASKLDSLSKEKSSEESKRVKEKLQELSDKRELLQGRLDGLLEKVKSDKSEEISKQIAAKEKAIKQREEEIMQKDDLIAAQNEEISKQIAAKEEAIKQREEEIMQKDDLIAAQNEEISKQIAAKEEAIKQKEEEIRQRDEQIAAQSKAIEKRNKLISTLSVRIKDIEELYKAELNIISTVADKLEKASDVQSDNILKDCVTLLVNIAQAPNNVENIIRGASADTREASEDTHETSGITHEAIELTGEAGNV